MKNNKKIIGILLSFTLVISTLMLIPTNAYCATKKNTVSERTTITSNKNELAKDVFNKINQIRKQKGLNEYTWNEQIVAIANERAKSIASSFRHTLPNGEGFESLYSNAGITYSALGENIAYGFTTADAVVDGWLKHTDHKEMIYSSAFTDCVIGIYISPEGKIYYAAEFMAK